LFGKIGSKSIIINSRIAIHNSPFVISLTKARHLLTFEKNN